MSSQDSDEAWLDKMEHTNQVHEVLEGDMCELHEVQQSQMQCSAPGFVLSWQLTKLVTP